jgi:glycosyltransferase involved in cell wall biosynthesis
VRSLHLISSDARRGAETFAVELSAELTQAGHEATVLALRPSGEVSHHDVPTLGERRRSGTAWLALRRAAGTTDLVVAHGSRTLEACAVSLRGTGVPFMYRTIGDPSYWAKTLRRRGAVGLMLRRAERHVALWDGAAVQLQSRYGIDRRSIDVIPNAVPTPQFPRAADDDRRRARSRFGLEGGRACLAFVGALSEEKNVASLLLALQALDAVLLVAGEGPERQRLDTLAERLGGRVRFVGGLADPYLVYAAADLLVLPSHSEGMPAVVIEAGLVGTPSLVSPVGALVEMISDGIDGYLLSGPTPDAIAAGVERAFADGLAARHTVAGTFGKRYSMASVAPTWETAMERAVGC